MKTYIISGNHGEFLNWCKYNGHDPESDETLFVPNLEALDGVNEGTFVRYGSYWSRPDIRDIDKRIRNIRDLMATEALKVDDAA